MSFSAATCTLAVFAAANSFASASFPCASSLAATLCYCCRLNLFRRFFYFLLLCPPKILYVAWPTPRAPSPSFWQKSSRPTSLWPPPPRITFFSAATAATAVSFFLSLPLLLYFSLLKYKRQKVKDYTYNKKTSKNKG